MLSFIYKGLEKALNQALKLDPDTKARLMDLQGKVIKISLTDLQLDCYLLPAESEIKLLAEYAGNIDTTICGTSVGLAKVAYSGASGSVLFDQGIVIIGDIELGEKIRDILKKVDLDWEEYLSRYVGDSLTHEISWRGKRALEFGKQTFQAFSHQILEFCQTEAQYLPKQQRVEAFYQDIAHLRDDVDRAAVRLDQIAQRISR